MANIKKGNESMKKITSLKLRMKEKQVKFYGTQLI